MAVQRKMFTLMAIAAMLIEVTMAANYTVGAPGGGWDLQTDLTAWASTNTFFVGDNLLFSYGPTHNVLEVSETDYEQCVTSNSITFDASGSTIFSLASPIKRYFICGAPGHCLSGMKVELDTRTTSTPPPATPATPPPASPATPPPASPATPPPATPATPPPASPATPPPASPATPPPATPATPPPASPATPPPASPKTSPPGVSPISPISPSTPSAKLPTSKSAMPPSGPGLAPPPSNGASAPKSGLYTTLAMGVVGIMMVFLSL